MHDDDDDDDDDDALAEIGGCRSHRVWRRCEAAIDAR
jgi:hypothetical protein